VSAPTLAERLLQDCAAYDNATLDQADLAAQRLMRTAREVASALTLSDAERAERERLAKDCDAAADFYAEVGEMDKMPGEHAKARVLRGGTATGGSDG